MRAPRKIGSGAPLEREKTEPGGQNAKDTPLRQRRMEDIDPYTTSTSNWPHLNPIFPYFFIGFLTIIYKKPYKKFVFVPICQIG